MTATNDLDRRIREHLAEGPTELPDRTYAVVRAAAERTLQRVALGPVLGARPATAFRFSIVAVALVIVAAVGVTLVPGGGPGGPAASALPSASLTPSTRPDAHVGLPPEGATPSDPTPGEIAIYHSGSIGAFGETWIYEDGRLITWRFNERPDDPSDGFIGLVTRLLTPEGVDFLRSAIVGTGMFQSDFALAREGNAPFLEIRVRNGDALIQGRWAWRGITGDAPTASPEEEAALLMLDALITDPGSWPLTGWADPTHRAYVPSEYAICFGVWLPNAGLGEWAGPFEQPRVLALLPRSAQDLLRTGVQEMERSGMHADAGCARLTTDAARELAQALDDAGVTPWSQMASYWLGYRIEDPRLPEHEILIQFGPMLPHREAVWLGPG
jgi:hypothetical protein